MAFLAPTLKNELLDSPGSSAFDLPAHQELGLDTNVPNSIAVSRSHTPGLIAHDEGPSFVVISGGTGCNSICSAFGNATYVLPVSDDGGSSSEIIRVIGGPSIGVCETTHLLCFLQIF